MRTTNTQPVESPFSGMTTEQLQAEKKRIARRIAELRSHMQSSDTLMGAS